MEGLKNFELDKLDESEICQIHNGANTIAITQKHNS